jgi:phosphopantothenoylcysteine decarboxylase/phosphopantothenate--cysteine ligase
MTKNAKKFISSLTFEALTSNKVYSDEFDEQKYNTDITHIDLTNWADIFIVAPATANIIGKINAGIADNLLTSTITAYPYSKKIIISPAMNTNMFENEITQRNIQNLKKLGYMVLEPDSGELACRTSGKGKMPEPEILFNYIESELETLDEYKGINFLVTAGPTREDIDPVRFISNRSSGKMGLAISKGAKTKSAEVITIVGDIDKSLIGHDMIQTLSAHEMLNKLKEHITEIDIFIMAAAVADYKVANYSEKKIKKNDSKLILQLEKNPDILKELSKSKKDNQVFVGFAAETDEIEKNAIAKLKNKNLDMIVANDVSRKDIAFDSDYNEITIYLSDGTVKNIGKMLKNQIADYILKLAVEIFHKKNA